MSLLAKTTVTSNAALLQPLDQFAPRHLGPRPQEIADMLTVIGVDSLDQLIDQTIPANIRMTRPLTLPEPRSESEVLAELRTLAGRGSAVDALVVLENGSEPDRKGVSP